MLNKIEFAQNLKNTNMTPIYKKETIKLITDS